MSEKQWSTGLFQASHIAHYAMAAVCPCQSIYHLYGTHPRARTTDPALSCFLASLSVCVVAPPCLCVDQFATRTIDGALLAHSLGAGEPSLASSMLTMAGYGQPSDQHWASDQSGYDLQEDDSENWWPLRMCGVYAWSWLSGACGEGRVCGPTATRLPLWLACLAGAAYPVTLCPMAFMLRRIVAERSGINEPLHETCMITACCFPCSLVQMEAENWRGARRVADGDDYV